MEPIKKHWQKEGFSFDAIYTGYLGSEKQITLVKDYFKTFGNTCKYIIVDPAMADNGKLYSGFDKEFPLKIGKTLQVCRRYSS